VNLDAPVRLAFQSDDGFGSRARIGMVVLATDQTLEVEARLVEVEGVAYYHARIPNDSEVTVETLTAMEARLPVAAGLLPAHWDFDVIGYGCTSASTLIGEQRVTEALQTAHPGVPCTTPITAAVAAFEALGIDRIAVVTPYSATVTAPVVEHFGKAGILVTAVGSFLEEEDFAVARVTEASVAAGVRTMVEAADCDGVFVSCTSLRTFGIIDELETELGIPVVSSNLALNWHLLRICGVRDNAGPGRLFSTDLARNS